MLANYYMLHQNLNNVTLRVASEIQKAEAVEYFLYIHVLVCVNLGGFLFNICFLSQSFWYFFTAYNS